MASDEYHPLRRVLAVNVRNLMAAKPGLHSIRAVWTTSQDMGGSLTNGTVERIKNGDSATDVDKLEDLAQVFGLEPWQLLVENLDPAKVPLTIPSSQAVQALLTTRADLTRKEDGAGAHKSRQLPNVSPGDQAASRRGTSLSPALLAHTDVVVRGKQGDTGKAATRRDNAIQKPRVGRGAQGTDTARRKR